MLSLQFTIHPLPPSQLTTTTNISSFSSTSLSFFNNHHLLRYNVKTLKNHKIIAMSSNNNKSSTFKMNLNEYLVTLEKPLGIRFALTSDGKIIVHSLAKGVSKLKQSKVTSLHVVVNQLTKFFLFLFWF
jgi:hypothetical protein